MERDALLIALATGAAAPAQTPIEAALVGGASAATVGEAFLAGYRAALGALVPSLGAAPRACLCATEEGGVHPRAIAARLTDGRVSGRKKWVTGGGLADRLLVFVALGPADAGGRVETRLCVVDAAAAGVEVRPLAPLPFVPEIPHAEVWFDGVPALEVLPGDGWERYVKPFRTIEDLHVQSAVLAYVLAVGRRSGWPDELRERLLALLVAARALAALDARAPETHLALAGLLGLGRALLAEAEPLWEQAAPEVAAGWRRDRPLLDVASRARAERAVRARQSLAP